jgi:hypothetical protein
VGVAGLNFPFAAPKQAAATLGGAFERGNRVRAHLPDAQAIVLLFQPSVFRIVVGIVLLLVLVSTVQAVAAQVLVSAERLQRMCLLKSKFLFDFHVVSYNFLSVLVTDGRYQYSIS